LRGGAAAVDLDPQLLVLLLEVYAPDQRLKQQVQELRIEIDRSRAASQVAEITETDYFRELQERARTLRAKAKTSESS